MLFTLSALSLSLMLHEYFALGFVLDWLKNGGWKKWKPCWNMNRHYYHYHFLVLGSELRTSCILSSYLSLRYNPALDWVRMMSSICLLPYLSTFCHLSPWHSLSAMLLHFIYLLIGVSSRSRSSSVLLPPQKKPQRPSSIIYLLTY